MQTVLLEYVTIPTGCGGITPEVVTGMLGSEDGHTARPLYPGEPIPFGACPVVVGDTTVYSAARIEEMVRVWHFSVPRPWVVLVPDAPLPTPKAARYRLRALERRFAGLTFLKFMPVLRTADSAETALADPTVRAQQQALIAALRGDSK